MRNYIFKVEEQNLQFLYEKNMKSLINFNKIISYYLFNLKKFSKQILTET